jgi:hypothetical protein
VKLPASTWRTRTSAAGSGDSHGTVGLILRQTLLLGDAVGQCAAGDDELVDFGIVDTMPGERTESLDGQAFFDERREIPLGL